MRSSPLFVLALAILGISIAAPLIRYSDAHPITIAVWRLAIAEGIILLLLVRNGQWRQWRTLSRGDLGLATGAGVLLAMHFWWWNASLLFTTVAASVVLVNLQPIFVAIGSAVWLREAPGRRQYVGIGVAMAGALLVAWFDLGPGGLGTGSRALLGDALALGGGVTAAGYYLVGRRLRATLDVWPYVGLVYGACLVTLVVLGVALDVPFAPQPAREWAIFAALALGPMLLGHTGMNWALGHLPAYVVNLAVLGEPIGATLLAAMLPGIAEVPSLATIGGGALILTGILVTARRGGRGARATGAG
jgi:drug/metabolite transporter (DMT)-like permease